ncbi:MAG: hypothetical protein AAF709_05835 [Pseudomonadota bacterium]
MTAQFLHNLASFVVLVLFPTSFWFGVAELLALSLQYPYGGIERLTVGGGIFLLTLWVWALLRITGDEE